MVKLVLENIYYSSQYECSYHINDLPSNVNTIICFCDFPRFIKSCDLKKIIFNSKKKPLVNEQWLLQLPIIHTIIIKNLKKGGIWLIASNKCIIKFIIISYLMSIQKSPLIPTMLNINTLQNFTLSYEFFYYLQLWQKMNGKLDKNLVNWNDLFNSSNDISIKKPIKRICTRSILECNDRIHKIVEQRKNGEFNILSLSSIDKSQHWGYCCASCKTGIIETWNILHHNPSKYQPIISPKYPCSIVTVEPLRWMEGIDMSEDGNIYCFGCSIHIGYFNWNPCECPSCNKKLNYCFALYSDLLIYVAPPIFDTPGVHLRTKSLRGRSLKRFFSLREKPTKRETKVVKKVTAVEKNSKRVTIIASCCEELPPATRKIITKSISLRKANSFWFITKRILLYLEKLEIKDTTTELRWRYKGKPLKHLPDTIKGIQIFTNGTKFEDRIPELFCIADDMPPLRVLDHPLIFAYLSHVEADWKQSNVPLLDTNIINYFDLATVSLINASDPRNYYKLGNKLGKGGYGTVYMAKDLKNNIKIAIKKMQHRTKKQKYSNFKEIATLSFCSHPNIVAYYDCHELSGELWAIMEHMEGGSLQDLQGFCTFNENQIAYIARECLNGLLYLKEIGICHRDIKGGNIMLTVDGLVKLIDFGICDTTQRVVEQAKMIGSLLWMPPEMIAHAPQSPKGDIWSLGCTLYKLLNPSGLLLNTGFNTLFVVATEGRKNIFESCTNISNELQSFLSAMLQKNPHERATPKQLLNHPFLQNKDLNPRLLRDVIGQFIAANRFAG